MKSVVALFGFLTAAGALAQEATLDLSPDKLPAADPAITDCAMDFKKRGRPTEKPLDPTAVAGLRKVLDMDLRASSGGFDELHALEPLCFYFVPDGRLLLRDGRGLEYYFQQVPKWQLDRVDITTRPN